MKRSLLAVVLAFASAASSQTVQNPASPGVNPPTAPQENQAPSKNNPDTKAPAPKGPAVKSAPQAQATTAAKGPDRATAYYHYSLAHMYEELVSMYGRTEFASKAVDEYKLALQYDPDSQYLNAGLAELYAKTGRIRDAVLEAQDIIKRDPNNVEARKLLGRIYLRSLGDMQSGTQSQELLRLAIEQYEAIAKLEPNDADNHLLLGRLYKTNNDLLKAEQEFKTAVRIEPTSEDAVTTLALMYDDEGDNNKALQTLNAFPESERTSKFYVAAGYTYEQQKDYKNAIAAYKKAVDEDHDNLDALRGLAQNLLNDGQVDAALEQYRVIADADPQDAQAQLRLAEIYRRVGKFDQALDSLKKAELVIGQDSIEVPYNRALVYEAQGRFDDAAQTLQTLLQKSAASGNMSPAERNNRAVFLERLGTVYRENNKHQLAVETFRKMTELGPENAARGYDEIIETYRDQKMWNQATATAQEAVKQLPNNRELKLVYAGQLGDAGKGDEAVAQVRSLLTGKPDDREVYIALAQVNSRLRRWKDAEEAINKALALSTKQEEKDYINFILGSIYERQKKYDQAEELFKSVLKGDPSNAMVLNYLGYMLADRGVRLDEALGYIRKAVQLDPQNGAYLDSLGWAYFKLGKYDLAEENLRKASDRIGNDATVQDHLGDLFQRTGRLKLAAAHWERAIEEWNKSVPAEIDPENLAKAQQKLESAKVKLARENNSNR